MNDRTEREVSSAPEARVSRLPWRDGDGYSYGGDVILTVGLRAIALSNSKDDEDFAKRLADAWNRRPTEALAGKGGGNGQ